jgi:hypothetical protein
MADYAEVWNSSAIIAALPITPICRFLDTVGDGTGTKNANGNYAAATVFRIQPGANQVFVIKTLTWFMRDNSAFNSGSYGGGLTLTNGVILRTQNGGGTIYNFMDGLNVFTNADIARLAGIIDYVDLSSGTGDDFLRAVIDFEQLLGQPLTLTQTNNNERLEIVLQDNFTGLIQHRFQAGGYVQ